MNQEHLPRWFIRLKSIAFELALGLGISLIVLKYFLNGIMKADDYDLAVSVITPMFLSTLTMSCSRAIEVIKRLKQSGNE